MTFPDPSELKPGPRLDEEVAKALGWRKVGARVRQEWALPGDGGTWGPVADFTPSTSMGVAWQLVEKLQTAWRFDLSNHDDGKWCASFTLRGAAECELDIQATPTVAICGAIINLAGRSARKVRAAAAAF